MNERIRAESWIEPDKDDIRREGWGGDIRREGWTDIHREPYTDD